MLEKKTYYEEQLKKERDLFEKAHKEKEDMKFKFTNQRNELEDKAET